MCVACTVGMHVYAHEAWASRGYICILVLKRSSYLATSGQSLKSCCRVRAKEDFTMSPVIWTTATCVDPTLIDPWAEAWSEGVMVLERDLVRSEAFKEWLTW